MKTIPSSVTSRTTGAVIAPLSLGPSEELPLDFVLGLAYDQFKNAKKKKTILPLKSMSINHKQKNKNNILIISLLARGQQRI